ncbi:hypothetical protein NIES2101_43750 [Calothrix sp. HK-06]|nr:hypothetical protein NIES2101_43750 [Calothrix sp. HK-06]
MSSCQKERKDKRVDFSETEYNFLSPYDENGKPSNLQKDVISQELINFRKQSLPEQKDLRNSPLLTNNQTTDIRVTKKSDIFVTYLGSGTSYKNAIAFYTYPTSAPPAKTKDIRAITYIFPNAGYRTTLVSGDKVKIGTFEPGTSIGFVLLQDGWNLTTKKPNNKAAHFCYNDILNPEEDPSLRKHVVLVDYAAEKKVLVGFEDEYRTSSKCDHDFNDVVIYTTINEL